MVLTKTLIRKLLASFTKSVFAPTVFDFSDWKHSGDTVLERYFPIQNLPVKKSALPLNRLHRRGHVGFVEKFRVEFEVLALEEFLFAIERGTPASWVIKPSDSSFRTIALTEGGLTCMAWAISDSAGDYPYASMYAIRNER